MNSKRVTQFLIDNKITISFMESCTAGLLASMLTDTPGASEIFQGSLVTYSNEKKIEAGVDAAIIADYGVYSAECAAAMAGVVRTLYGTAVSIGITGTTGNIDLQNPESSSLGEAYYCIIVDEIRYDYYIKIDTVDMTRSKIKQYYANKVYQSLGEILQQSIKCQVLN